MANGLPAFLLQVEVTSANKWLDFIYDITTYAVLITTGTYDDMRAVAAAFEAAMDIAEPIPAPWSVTIDINGKVNFAHSGGPIVTFNLLWKTGVHGSDNADDHCGDLFGYDDSANDIGSPSYVADYQHQLGWYSDHGPTFDSRDRARRIGPATFTAVSGKSTRTTFATHYPRRVDLAWITKEKFWPAFSALNEDFETWWIEAASGTPFAFYSSTDTWVDEGNFVLVQTEDEDLLDQVPRLSPGEERYSITLRMIKQT